MAEFLTTSGVSYRIEDIIRNAKKSVVLVSPYLQFSRNFFERLKEAESHNVDITIIFGKNELQAKEAELLSGLKKLNLFFSETLHAKCYFNEFEMVITSMNMYEYSEKNNREMGIFIAKKSDETLYNAALKETLSIMQFSEAVALGKGKAKKKVEKSVQSKKEKSTRKVSKTSSCIRCKTDIPFNMEKPYCKSCFNSWAFYGNPSFEEKVCHNCGEENKSTIEKPVCYSCYKTI